MIALKSDGIYLIENGAEKKYLSPFISQKIDSAARSDKHSGWKQKDDGESGGLFARSTLWGRQNAPFIPPHITQVHEHEKGFVYVIKMARAAGLFHYDRETDSETRLFHKENFNPAGLSVTSKGIVTTVDSVDGSRHLAMYDCSGKNEVAITCGDCVDEHPCCGEEAVYYDSRGIGRAQNHSIGAFGPRGIYCISYDGQNHEVIRESTRFEYLIPKVAPNGAVYALRIPWDNNVLSLWSSLRAVLMFPFVMAMAIIGFLNVFSLIFAKRTILTAGHPELPSQDLRKRMIHSKLLDIQRPARGDGKGSVAPKSWKLVRIDKEEDIEINNGVIGFNLNSSGLFINTGFGIFSDKGEELYKSNDLILDFTL
jgi:hypothetical protein